MRQILAAILLALPPATVSADPPAAQPEQAAVTQPHRVLSHKDARWMRLAPCGDPAPTAEQARRFTACFDTARNMLVHCFGRTACIYRHKTTGAGRDAP
jgi:hypothetical protein